MKKSSLLVLVLLSSSFFLGGCFNNTPEAQTSPIVESGSNDNDIKSDTGSIDIISTGENMTGITLADIALHNTETDCRAAIDGKVYDVSAFFGRHPGGDKNLFRVCGIDATDAYDSEHGTDNIADSVLAKFIIGTLVK